MHARAKASMNEREDSGAHVNARMTAGSVASIPAQTNLKAHTPDINMHTVAETCALEGI